MSSASRRGTGPVPVLFRAPAGPRRGFGHLLRCRALARAMGVVPHVSVRGTSRTARIARALGCVVVPGGPVAALRATGAAVLVVDDVVRQAAARWILAAQRCGVPVASLHDLGLGCLAADLVVDGSVTRTARVAGRRGLLGTRYAVTHPVGPRATARARRAPARRVLVALGGGPRRRLALAIARVVVKAVPGATVRIAGGFGAGGAASLDPGIRWTGVQDGLGREFAACDVAVVAGGVSLYEACAAGVPSVALPVVTAQVPTVSAFARRGACIGVGRPSSATVADAAGRAAVSLLAAPASRARLSTRARRLVDGEGARRVASAVWALAGRPS